MKEGSAIEFNFDRYAELFHKNLYLVATDEEKHEYAREQVKLNRLQLELANRMAIASEKESNHIKSLTDSQKELYQQFEQVTSKQNELLAYLESDQWFEKLKGIQEERPMEYTLSNDSMVQLSILNALTIGCVLLVGYVISRLFGGII